MGEKRKCMTCSYTARVVFIHLFIVIGDPSLHGLSFVFRKVILFYVKGFRA
jgi:hypothetical protein